MEGFLNHVMLSRVQFAYTAMFHILWPVLTIGLSLFLVVLEAMWLKTKDELYFQHARFWARLFFLNVAVGVVTGIPLEFQFGTNWSVFSVAGGDFFGHLMGFEAAMAFMLEATFIGIMAFGWKRVSPAMHLFATSMVALGASLSAFWIMSANSWMQTPAGGFFDGGYFATTSNLEAIFNPSMPWAVSHMWVACLEITVFVVGGISAWYLLKGRHAEFFLKSFKWAVVAAIIITPLQIILGHGSGVVVHEYQPTKLAAMEAHWETNPPDKGAPYKIIAWPDQARQDNAWAVEVPDALSFILTGSRQGQVKGLRDFPPEDQPPVFLTYYAFHIMTAIGFALVLVMLWSLRAWYRGNLTTEHVSGQKKLLYAWMVSLPLSYLAMETGWITRESGRQPWIIYGLMRTSDSATNLPTQTVGTSLITFSVVYTLLFVLFLVFARRILAKGPDLKRTGG